MTKALKLLQASVERALNRPRPVMQFVASRIKQRREELRKMLQEGVEK